MPSPNMKASANPRSLNIATRIQKVGDLTDSTACGSELSDDPSSSVASAMRMVNLPKVIFLMVLETGSENPEQDGKELVA